MVAGADAPRQVPRPRRRRLPPRLRGDHRRRPRDRRRRSRSPIRRATSTTRARSRSTAAACETAGHARVVYLVNKPAGVVSTAKDPQGRRTVVALVPSRERLYPVGRLDYDTTGLILLTNDGDLAHRLTHPSFEVPRTYRARIANAPINEPALRALREGVELEDGADRAGEGAAGQLQPSSS